MKKIFILLALLINLQTINEAAVKNTQVNTKKTEYAKEIENELEKADGYYYNNKLLIAKKIYEKYSSSSNKAKLKLVNYYNEDLHVGQKDEDLTRIIKW